MPTSSHLFYIPLVLLLGIIIGVVLGRRSVLVQQAEVARRQKLEDSRAARAARNKAKTHESSDTDTEG